MITFNLYSSSYRYYSSSRSYSSRLISMQLNNKLLNNKSNQYSKYQLTP